MHEKQANKLKANHAKIRINKETKLETDKLGIIYTSILYWYYTLYCITDKLLS